MHDIHSTTRVNLLPERVRGVFQGRSDIIYVEIAQSMSMGCADRDTSHTNLGPKRPGD